MSLQSTINQPRTGVFTGLAMVGVLLLAGLPKGKDAAPVEPDGITVRLSTSDAPKPIEASDHRQPAIDAKRPTEPGVGQAAVQLSEWSLSPQIANHLTPRSIHKERFAESLNGQHQRIELGDQLSVLQNQLGVPLAHDTFTRDWHWIRALVDEVADGVNPALPKDARDSIAGTALLHWKRFEVQTAVATITQGAELSAVVKMVDGATKEQRGDVFGNFEGTLIRYVANLMPNYTASLR